MTVLGRIKKWTSVANGCRCRKVCQNGHNRMRTKFEQLNTKGDITPAQISCMQFHGKMIHFGNGTLMHARCSRKMGKPVEIGLNHQREAFCLNSHYDLATVHESMAMSQIRAKTCCEPARDSWLMKDMATRSLLRSLSSC
jgi:hypothetical protein